MFLPSASTTPDSPSCRYGSHRPASARIHHLQTGLLQLSVSRCCTVYFQRTAACLERCSSADFQSRGARPRQRQSDRTTLAGSTGAYNTNLKYAYAWNHHRQVSWLSANHRPTSHYVSSRASFGGVPCTEVRHTATTWRACLQLRRPSRVELTSYRHAVYNWDTDIKNCWNLIFSPNV